VEQAVLAMKGEKLKEFFPIEGTLITKDNLASYPGWSE
jgi:hypothetical protein